MKGWPRLAKETKDICIKLRIENCNITQVGKIKYREYVTEACHILNEERLRSKTSDVKCARITNEQYGKKSYILHKNKGDTRDTFRACFGLADFAGNYSHARKFAKTDWLCFCQEASEKESHLL